MALGCRLQANSYSSPDPDVIRLLSSAAWLAPDGQPGRPAKQHCASGQRRAVSGTPLQAEIAASLALKVDLNRSASSANDQQRGTGIAPGRTTPCTNGRRRVTVRPLRPAISEPGPAIFDVRASFLPTTSRRVSTNGIIRVKTKRSAELEKVALGRSFIPGQAAPAAHGSSSRAAGTCPPGRPE